MKKLAKLAVFGLLCSATVGENIIATTKKRNNYGAI